MVFLIEQFKDVLQSQYTLTIGKGGLSEGFIKEIKNTLKKKGIFKIKISSNSIELDSEKIDVKAKELMEKRLIDNEEALKIAEKDIISVEKDLTIARVIKHTKSFLLDIRGNVFIISRKPIKGLKISKKCRELTTLSKTDI